MPSSSIVTSATTRPAVRPRAIARLRPGRGPIAVVLLALFVILAPVPGRADLAAAQQALNEKNYRKALADAVDAIDDSPVDAYRIRAVAYAGLGELENALGQMQRALSFAPLEKGLIVETGRACLALGRKDQAAAYIEKAVAMDANDYDLLLEYLGLLDGIIRFDDYVTVGNSALARFPQPDRQRALNARIATVEEKRREYARAAEHYSRSYEGTTATADQLLSLGKVWLNAKRWSKAVEVLDRALLADPRRDEITFFLGRALWEQGQRDEAGELYIELKNADSRFWDQLSFGEQRHTLIQFRPAARVLHSTWGIFPFLVGLCIALGIILFFVLIYLYRLRRIEE